MVAVHDIPLDQFAGGSAAGTVALSLAGRSSCGGSAITPWPGHRSLAMLCSTQPSILRTEL